MSKKQVLKLVQLALLVALEVVLSRFLSINTAVVKIGFGFVPIAVAAMLYGPWAGAAVAASADFLGAVLFPIGPYFPGFTLTAALVGCVYGVFLYKRPSLPRIIAAVAVISLPLHLMLNTLWIAILYDKGFWALLPTRILQCVLMALAQVLILWLFASRIRLLKRSEG